MVLTIRNLTASVLELKLVERFKPADTGNAASGKGAFASISNLIKNFINLMSFQVPAAGELSEHAQSFEDEDVSIRIDGSSTRKTDIDPTGDNVLRLTFENEGQKHRIEVPVPSSRSVAITPLVPNPKNEYKAIYLPNHQYLTIFSSSKLKCWMSNYKDETPITGLSIPGTHNSPTCHRALPSVRCQAVAPREQLENGVRFFDLRVQPETPQDPSKDGLILVHSVFPISLTGGKYFRDLVNEVHDFLDKNSSETVIISVKREGAGSATDAQLGNILHKHYAGDVNKWFTAPHVPKLGEARGKIVLIRRFGLDDQLKKEWSGKGWGINAESWADNTPHALTPDGQLCVQDFYEVLDTETIEKKVLYSTEQLARAAATTTPLPGMEAQHQDPTKVQPLFINFLSASNFWKVGCWPERIAARLNSAVVDHLCRSHNEPADGKKVGDGCTGIVVCDWVGSGGDWDLVHAIVGMNAKLEIREHQ